MSDIIDSLNAQSASQSSVIAGKLVGWSPSDISSVQQWIDNATMVDADSVAIQGLMALALQATDVEVLDLLTKNAKAEIKEVTDALQEGFVVQDAKTPLIQAEPKSTNAQGAVDQPPLNYSLDKNNEDSYGFIDSVKNWFKIDKKTRRVESVLANGALIRIDRDGNATIHTPGTVKEIIGGNYIVDVGGTYQVIAANKIEQIKGSVKETYGSHDTTISGQRNEKASRISHN